MNNIKNQIKRFNNSKRVALIYRLGFCTAIYLVVSTAIGIIFTNHNCCCDTKYARKQS